MWDSQKQKQLFSLLSSCPHTPVRGDWHGTFRRINYTVSKGEVEKLLCGPTWLAWEETVFVNAEVGKAWGCGSVCDPFCSNWESERKDYMMSSTPCKLEACWLTEQ